MARINNDYDNDKDIAIDQIIRYTKNGKNHD